MPTVLDFPDNPTPSQRFAASNGVLYLWNAQMGLWVVLHDDPSAAGMFAPSGAIVDFAGASAPNGWYLCDGSLKNRDIDAPLFAAIGELYGAGDGVTTFALPDLRGRVTAGVDGDADRLPDWILGAAGGEWFHTLNPSEMPVHSHSVYDAGHGHGDYGHGHGVGDPAHIHATNAAGHVGSNSGLGGSGGGGLLWAGEWLGSTDYRTTGIWLGAGAANISVSGTGIWLYNAGGGGGHNNVQPTMALNKIIKR